MNSNFIKQIRLNDNVLAPRQKTGHDVTIPSSLKRSHETGRIDAFLLNWKEGMPNKPHIYWDSDVAKVVEGMAQMFMLTGDEALRKELDELVDRIVSAQQADGYLNVYFTIIEPENRWKSTSWAHELYCAGHLIEAAVAHCEATGSRKFLDSMCRYADHIATVFGRGKNQKRAYPGHEEIELALVKLYRATGEKRYLELAKYFIDERGTKPFYWIDTEKTIDMEEQLVNLQAHKPVREQTEAVGHAVRAVYLYCGMVDVATETGDTELLNSAIRLFDHIITRRMYVTGGIGSTHVGEAFGADYALPNDTAYAESCAAIGLVFFAKRLLDVTGDRKYADVMERVLYNNALSGLSLSGDEFFYANPLASDDSMPEFHSYKKTRRKWFNCSCCPTNYCRFLPQLGLFCYTPEADRLRIDIPVSAEIETDQYQVRVDGAYPYDGKIRITVCHDASFTLSIRIPGYAETCVAKLNGRKIEQMPEKGYLNLKRAFREGDVLEISFEIKTGLVYANVRVADDAGKAAILRGPLVYCLESCDNPGIPLHSVILSSTTNFKMEAATGLPEGTVGLSCDARMEYTEDSALYRNTPPESRPVHITAIPYALWQNRGQSDMRVFLRVAY